MNGARAKRFLNPRSGLDEERLTPILKLVEENQRGHHRPQLVRVIAWREDQKVGLALCTTASARYAATGYPDATHLEVEVLGNA